MRRGVLLAGTIGTLTFTFPGLVWLHQNVAAAQTTDRAIREDAGRQLLRCYHRTGLFERAVEIGESELSRRGRWGSLPEGTSGTTLRERYDAASVRFIRVYWRGAATGSAYQSDIAVMTRLHVGAPQVRTAILSDTSPVPAIDRLCPTAMGWIRQNGDSGIPL